MCGIAGVWRTGREQATPGMLERLHHRGPDAHGTWTESGAPWLGHTRLSILDLSDAGAQPMMSPSGRYVLTFNGEIYDHLRHRAALPVQWRGHADTETSAALCDAHGAEEAIRLLSGMMAIAIWDRDERVLWLARDRFGKKPLLWSRLPDGIAFASELSALRTVPGIGTDLDATGLRAMLERMAVPDDRSILQGTHKVPPGALLRFDAPDAEPVATVLHDLHADALQARAQGASKSLAGHAPNLDQLENALRSAVADRQLSDVPLGAFLSGGIDSSLVVALMTEVASDVRTFTIGFEEAAHDEAPHARAVAEHLGTDHTERILGPEDALAAVHELARVYDEPFADSSQLPTLLLCREARQHVTVALSGDGGDELFGGYARYQHAAKLARLRRSLPGPLGRIAAGALDAIPPALWNRLPGPANSHRAARLAEILRTKGNSDLYDRLVTSWPNAASTLVDPGEPSPVALPAAPDSLLARMMLADTRHYLRDDILVKVDRAAMSTSLEVRCPLLDPKVFEAAWRLPDAAKMQRGVGKLPLRSLLKTRVPERLWDRPKQGFGMPVASWLRGSLQSWADELLDAQRLTRQGLLRPEPVRRMWDAHQAGRRDHHAELWNLLMFQTWWDQWKGEDGSG